MVWPLSIWALSSRCLIAAVILYEYRLRHARALLGFVHFFDDGLRVIAAFLYESIHCRNTWSRIEELELHDSRKVAGNRDDFCLYDNA